MAPTLRARFSMPPAAGARSPVPCGPMRRTALIVDRALLLAACARDGSDDRAGRARDVTGITDPTVDRRPRRSPSPTETSAPVEPLDYTIEWTQLGDRVDEGTITVPVDYADPQGDTIDLYVARHRATADPRRPMLANRGGPGADGATLALDATGWFGDEITDNFDVIGWDPRGTGRSEGAVDCIDDADYDQYFSPPTSRPTTTPNAQALVELAASTRAPASTGRHLQYVGTNNSARDIDAIRQALGAEQISYFGFSYGSELGGVWATLFPTTVRAAVFDGATDPNADPLQSSLQQGAGFEASAHTFLAQCSADAECPFHNDGDAEGAFDRLMASLDESPLPS
jgi:pimeloyl-ACP methyl ester carboxylesterase